ncbi:MAG: hypothetical protein CMJ35_09315 [Phycisphaerae bacterium]|nr:hypothetical protein [Phycisphaerae bacterium]MBM91794.1 hypothetical protein [Phycisphaerae bacterium]HCT44855.1 hypothetical protein [Phycisphaerales bacterium]
MRSTHTSCIGIAGAVIASLTTSAAAGPFASSVLGYDAGSNAAAGYTNALTALGSAERFTGEGVFPGGVTPFNPAFGTDELVSVGSGGHLSLGFDRQITNDTSHAFGIDFIVFSNAGFADASWSDANPDNDGSGLTGANPFIFGAGGEATIQVSQNGTEWFTASITTLDLFPTLGYSDYTETTPGDLGSVESDFTKAIDPSLALEDFANMSFAEIVALYDGSGGGIGIDIAGSGLETASYVRFLNNSGEAFEIDAVAIVPAPGALFMLGLGGIFATPRRR